MPINDGFEKYVYLGLGKGWAPRLPTKTGAYLIHLPNQNIWYVGFATDLKDSLSLLTCGIRNGKTGNKLLNSVTTTDKTHVVYLNTTGKVDIASEMIKKLITEYSETENILNAHIHMPTKANPTVSKADSNGGVKPSEMYVIDGFVYKTASAAGVSHGVMAVKVRERVLDPSFPTWELYDEVKHSHLRVVSRQPETRRRA